MTNHRQMNPYCVQVELTEGCNLRCSFCALNSIRGKENNFKFMTVETATAIADSMVRAGWNSRIEFAMHGEPTMNPNMLQIIKIFRDRLPKSYILMESNGGGLLKNTWGEISELFDNGLSTLALDEYQNIKLVPKIMNNLGLADRQITVTGRVCERGEKKPEPIDGAYWKGTIEYQTQHWKNDSTGTGIQYWDYPLWGNGGNPHQRNANKRLIRVRPIDVSTAGTHATLNNHCGGGAPLDYSAAGKRCAKPFREVSVRYDGNVAICCNDWRGVLQIGNVINQDLCEEIWHSELYYSIRRKLYQGERTFAPCLGCNAKTYRNGILPDHAGKVELPPASQQDEDLIAEALKNPQLAESVLRPWEK